MPQSVLLRYPSPIQWLAHQLGQAIASFSRVVRHQESTAYPESAKLFPETGFNLSISTNLRQFGTLASPVPLKLASTWQKSPQEIGAALIEQMSNQISPNAWLNPKFAIQPSGWLYVYFPGTELSIWLQTLLMAKPELHWIDPLSEATFAPISLGISEDPVLFQLQYAHARCCSLLRLAQQANIIERVGPDLQISPINIPWQTSEGALRLQNSSETRLLLALMELPRSLDLSSPKPYPLKFVADWTDTLISWPISTRHLQMQAQLWGDLFLNFYRESRLLGDIQTRTPELAQARSALIYITQTVLAFLLEQLFQIEAPTIL